MQERTQPPSVDNLTEARRAIEAMLLVANDPTPVQLLAQLVELPVDLVQSMCRELAGEYEAERRGFQLAEVAGGWRFQTHPDTHAYVERFALEGIPNRLSSAALETLAIVAYKQPISRAQVGAIRGVNVDGVLRTLVQRGYVDEQGRDDGPGQATLFGTTPFFLEQLGLMSLDDLPPLGDFVPSVEVLEALENTLRVDPEPEIVIIEDDDGETAAAETTVADESLTDDTVEGEPAEADADEPGEAAGPDAVVETTGDLDADAEPVAETDVEPQDDAEPSADGALEPDSETVEPHTADGETEHETVVEAEDRADDDGAESGAGEAELDDRSEPETPEPEAGHGSSNGSTNGFSNGSTAESSNGSGNGVSAELVHLSNGDTGDEAVYEIMGDPAASVIPLATHLANSTSSSSDDADADPQADAEFEAEPDVEPEVEADSPVAIDAEAGDPETVVTAGDAEDGPAAEDELIPEPVEQLIASPTDETEPEPAPEPEPDLAADIGVEPDLAAEIDIETEPEPEAELVSEPEPEPELDVEPEAEQVDAGAITPVPSDELEVTADPEVEQTDGPTETGAAGADDARFPGAGSAQTTDPAGAVESGQDAGGRLGQGASSAPQQGGPTPDPSSSWPEALTNGHRVDPESGDA